MLKIVLLDLLHLISKKIKLWAKDLSTPSKFISIIWL